MHSFLIYDITKSFDVGTFHVLPDDFFEYRVSDIQQWFSKGLFFCSNMLNKTKNHKQLPIYPKK